MYGLCHLVFAIYVCMFSCLKQESPPVWTQERYRPRRIKYYPRWGTPPPVGGTWGGVPPGQVQRGGRGYLRWGTPPGQVWWGVPKVGHPPIGYPPWPGPMRGTPVRVPPWPGLTGGYPRWGTPLQDLAGVPPQVWTDRRMDGQTPVKTYNLPSYYVRGR